MNPRGRVRHTLQLLLERSGCDWRSVFTEAGDCRLHHIEAGAGRALVLIHGGSGGGGNWYRVLASLSREFRVLAPDLPGFGLSAPIDPRAPLGVAAAERLALWLKRNDVHEAAVVGTSFGGLSALRLAQRTGRVTHLLLLDAAGLGRSVHPTVRLAAASPLTSLAVRPTRRGTGELFRRLLTSDLSAFPEDEQRLLVDYLYASALAAGTEYLARTLRLFCGALGQREVVTAAELRSVAPPVQIVWGARDRLLPPRHGERAATLIPNAHFQVLDGIGHSPNWESPDRLAAAVRVLLQRPLGPLPEMHPS